MTEMGTIEAKMNGCLPDGNSWSDKDGRARPRSSAHAPFALQDLPHGPSAPTGITPIRPFGTAPYPLGTTTASAAGSP